jgi:WD40 repeat protein
MKRSLFDFGFVAAVPSTRQDHSDNDHDAIEHSESADFASRPVQTDPIVPVVRPNVSLTDRSRLAHLRVSRAVTVAHACTGSSPESPIADVAFSADGELLTYGQVDGNIVVHKFSRDRPLVPALSLRVARARCRKLIWDTQNDSSVWVLVSGQHSPLRLFDLSRTMGESCASFEQDNALILDAVQLTPSTLAVSGSDSIVRVVDRRAHRVVATSLRMRVGCNVSATTLAWSADNMLLAVADSKPILSLWDIRQTAQLLRATHVGVDSHRRVAWLGFDDSRWPERLTFQLSDSTIGVWDTQRQQLSIPSAPALMPLPDWMLDRSRCAFLRSSAGSGGSVLVCGDRISDDLLFVDPSALFRVPRNAPPTTTRANATKISGEFFIDEYGDSHRVSNMTTLAVRTNRQLPPLTNWRAAVIGRCETGCVTSVVQHPVFDVVALGLNNGSVSLATV